jgi:hypothetical protein
LKSFVPGLFGILAWTSVCWAAHNARVDGADVPLYQGPDESTPVLQTMAADEPVVVSNLPTNGFYKTRSAKGVVGWLNSSSVALVPSGVADKKGSKDSLSSEKPTHSTRLFPRKNNRESKIDYKSIWFRGLGGVTFFNVPGIVTNLSNISNGYDFGGEVVVVLYKTLGVAVRFEQVFKKLAITDSGTSKNFTVDLTSLPLMLGPELDILSGPLFSLRVGLLMGWAFNSEVRSTNLTDTTNTVSDTVASGLTALGKVEINFNISTAFSIFAEGGYRYLQSPTMTPTANNGSLILQSSYSLTFSGAVANGGVSLAF